MLWVRHRFTGFLRAVTARLRAWAADDFAAFLMAMPWVVVLRRGVFWLKRPWLLMLRLRDMSALYRSRQQLAALRAYVLGRAEALAPLCRGNPSDGSGEGCIGSSAHDSRGAELARSAQKEGETGGESRKRGGDRGGSLITDHMRSSKKRAA